MGDHDSVDVAWDEVALVPDESEVCSAIVPDQEIAEPKHGCVSPHPSKRTTTSSQHT